MSAGWLAGLVAPGLRALASNKYEDNSIPGECALLLCTQSLNIDPFFLDLRWVRKRGVVSGKQFFQSRVVRVCVRCV